MPFTVHVSEKHIANNIPTSCTECAIAKAVQEQFPNTFVNIGGWTAYIGDKHYEMSVPDGFFIANRLFHERGEPAPDPIDVTFSEIEFSHWLRNVNEATDS